MLVADHEKLDVYRLALDVAVELDAIAKTIQSPRADLRDQLRRASASILLNIAEGASEFSPDEKARFYRMSRRSAAECMAILDLVSRAFRSTPPMRESKAKLIRVSSMLSRLIRVTSPSVPVSASGSVSESARLKTSNNIP